MPWPSRAVANANNKAFSPSQIGNPEMGCCSSQPDRRSETAEEQLRTERWYPGLETASVKPREKKKS